MPTENKWSYGLVHPSGHTISFGMRTSDADVGPDGVKLYHQKYLEKNPVPKVTTLGQHREVVDAMADGYARYHNDHGKHLISYDPASARGHKAVLSHLKHLEQVHGRSVKVKYQHMNDDHRFSSIPGWMFNDNGRHVERSTSEVRELVRQTENLARDLGYRESVAEDLISKVLRGEVVELTAATSYAGKMNPTTAKNVSSISKGGTSVNKVNNATTLIRKVTAPSPTTPSKPVAGSPPAASSTQPVQKPASTTTSQPPSSPTSARPAWSSANHASATGATSTKKKPPATGPVSLPSKTDSGPGAN